jgi:hypothetical protein
MAAAPEATQLSASKTEPAEPHCYQPDAAKGVRKSTYCGFLLVLYTARNLPRRHSKMQHNSSQALAPTLIRAGSSSLRHTSRRHQLPRLHLNCQRWPMRGAALLQPRVQGQVPLQEQTRPRLHFACQGLRTLTPGLDLQNESQWPVAVHSARSKLDTCCGATRSAFSNTDATTTNPNTQMVCFPVIAKHATASCTKQCTNAQACKFGAAT